jgi:hypothetical protein
MGIFRDQNLLLFRSLSFKDRNTALRNSKHFSQNINDFFIGLTFNRRLNNPQQNLITFLTDRLFLGTRLNSNFQNQPKFTLFPQPNNFTHYNLLLSTRQLLLNPDNLHKDLRNSFFRQLNKTSKTLSKLLFF